MVSLNGKITWTPDCTRQRQRNEELQLELSTGEIMDSDDFKKHNETDITGSIKKRNGCKGGGAMGVLQSEIVHGQSLYQCLREAASLSWKRQDIRM